MDGLPLVAMHSCLIVVASLVESRGLGCPVFRVVASASTVQVQ